MNITEIPRELYFTIASHLVPNDLVTMNKAYKQELPNYVWKKSLSNFGIRVPEPIPTLGYEGMGQLVGGTGCMCCKAPGIKKVVWEYRVRACENCIQAQRIPEKEIWPPYQSVVPTIDFKTKTKYAFAPDLDYVTQWYIHILNLDPEWGDYAQSRWKELADGKDKIMAIADIIRKCELEKRKRDKARRKEMLAKLKEEVTTYVSENYKDVNSDLIPGLNSFKNLSKNPKQGIQRFKRKVQAIIDEHDAHIDQRKKEKEEHTRQENRKRKLLEMIQNDTAFAPKDIEFIIKQPDWLKLEKSNEELTEELWTVFRETLLAFRDKARVLRLDMYFRLLIRNFDLVITDKEIDSMIKACGAEWESNIDSILQLMTAKISTIDPKRSSGYFTSDPRSAVFHHLVRERAIRTLIAKDELLKDHCTQIVGSSMFRDVLRTSDPITSTYWENFRAKFLNLVPLQ